MTWPATPECVWLAPPAALTLAGDEIHLWRAGLDQPAAEVQRLTQTLTPDELERAGRFHFERDRRRFIVGRGVLREILGRYYLGLEPGQVRFCYGERGKPGLVESQAGSTGRLHFNLAHSAELGLYAVTQDQEIGVDLEYIRPGIEIEQIAERFFSIPERAALRALPPEQRQEAFYNCWTRKEAFIKASGEGLAYPLDRFSVSLAPGEPARFLDIGGDVEEAARWFMQALIPAAGYVGAVVVKRPGWRVRCWDHENPGKGDADV